MDLSDYFADALADRLLAGKTLEEALLDIKQDRRRAKRLPKSA
jgi:hypothetical protein